MRILLITEFFPDQNCFFSGGVETRTFFIAKNLSKKHQVIVISRRKKGERDIEISHKLKIIRLGKEIKQVEANFYSVFSRFFFIFQSFFIGIKQNIDVVEGSNFICFPSAFAISIFKKIPVVAWYPDLYCLEWFKNFGLLTGMFGWTLEKIDLKLPWTKAIALSKQTKAKLIKAGIKEEKISIIYGGIDLNFIKKIKAKKFSNPTVCCISRLVLYKNIDILIKAIKFVKTKIKNVKCFIIGKGPEEERLKQLIKTLDLENNISFFKDLTYKKNIETLKSSHVFCLPSRIEGFGLVTIEAIAAGVPFVVSDIPINREISKGRGGLFFKTNDSLDLSKKILQLLLDKKFSLSLVLKGKGLLKIYDWQKISTQTEKVYQEALKN